MLPEESTATPYGLLKLAEVPTESSANPAVPVPASVPVPPAVCALAPTASEKADVEAPLCEGVPHERIDIEDRGVKRDAAEHWNQALAVHAAFPAGSAARSALLADGVVER